MELKPIPIGFYRKLGVIPLEDEEDYPVFEIEFRQNDI
jgi:hypothetical protein